MGPGARPGRRRARNDGEDAAPQFSSLTSSGVCGGVLIAIARLDLPFLVAQPDRPGAFEDVLDLVGVGMQVLRDIAVLHRDGATIGGSEHLGAEADGVGRTERSAYRFGTVA